MDPDANSYLKIKYHNNLKPGGRTGQTPFATPLGYTGGDGVTPSEGMSLSTKQPKSQGNELIFDIWQNVRTKNNALTFMIFS